MESKKDSGKKTLFEDTLEMREKNDKAVQDIKDKIQEEVPISPPIPFEVLLTEYKDNKFFPALMKLNKEAKVRMFRRARRDGKKGNAVQYLQIGNCFYRSYLVKLLEFIVKERGKEIHTKIEKKFRESKELMKKAKYDPLVYEDAYDMFMGYMTKLSVCTEAGIEPLLYDLFFMK